jgi:hypothetical protein
MQAINEKDHKSIIDGWFAEAAKQTVATLPDFIERICGGYQHDYGTICHAVAAAAVGAAWAADKHPSAGITGFQAGAVMWEFMRRWNGVEYPARLIKYEDMLYPQYEHHFQKTIPRKVMDALVAKAREKLQSTDSMHPNVRAHMESVAEGTPPFGYTVTDN